MSARLATTPNLRVITRDTAMTSAPPGFAGQLIRDYDIARDGRFLGLVTNKNDYQLVIVPSWLPELKQRLAGNKQ